MGKSDIRQLLDKIYKTLDHYLGDREWWPGETRDEIIIGAVLTQNTSWRNVEKALRNLKVLGWCDLEAISVLTPEEIAPYIRPAGYFNLKARRLHAVARFFVSDGKWRSEEIAEITTPKLRQQLLSVYGVGPETADSILLYALDRLTFVVDTYTIRIMSRHGLCPSETSYHDLQKIFHENVEADLYKYNQFHALLVWVGAYHCKPTPRCEGCPLAFPELCATSQAWSEIEKRQLEGLQKRIGSIRN